MTFYLQSVDILAGGTSQYLPARHNSMPGIARYRIVSGAVAEQLRHGSAKPSTRVRFPPAPQKIACPERAKRVEWAGVLELVDSADLKSAGCKPVGVRVSPPASMESFCSKQIFILRLRNIHSLLSGCFLVE